MKRRLLTQMRTEWRSNIWMIIELAIVGLIVSCIFMILSQLAYMYSRHIGYQTDNICIAECEMLDEDSDEYNADEDFDQTWDDVDIIVKKLRQNPYVELVGTGLNAMTYNHNYFGYSVKYKDGDSIYSYHGNQRYMSPEVIKILRLTGPNGETTEQLAAVIERGEWIVSTFDTDNQRSSGNIEPEKIVHHDVEISDGSARMAHIGAISYNINRDDYEGAYGTIICPIKQEGVFPDRVIVRVKPGMTRKFLESVNPKDMQRGNAYLTNMKSLDALRDNVQRNVTTIIRNIVTCAVFLLVAVFLGFLGSFWFRTQQRVPEIALRKVNGATPQQIFNRLISEGLILLLFGAIIFSPIYWYIVYCNIEEIIISNSNIPNIVAYIATLGVLAFMIVAGIWFPARRAMKVQPAEALKDQ